MNANKPVTKTLIMKHIGMDDFSCPVYQDQFGRLWKDIDLGEQDTPCLYSVTVIPHFIYIQIMLYSVELKAA